MTKQRDLGEAWQSHGQHILYAIAVSGASFGIDQTAFRNIAAVILISFGIVLRGQFTIGFVLRVILSQWVGPSQFLLMSQCIFA